MPNENWQPLDLIVVTRGGGSIEDLWEFNEEIVARAIVHSAVPIVSAVGHEIDFTICDFVADLRAPTPSAAAELIVSDIIDLHRRIDGCARVLVRQLLNRLRDAQQRLDHARETLQRCLAHKIDSYKRGLLHIAAALHARSPAPNCRNAFWKMRGIVSVTSKEFYGYSAPTRHCAAVIASREIRKAT
ncbi:MAG: hypothetical protein DME75_03150 [Verrucomicrobia bacterium]|nr:MAG: hypothetical protein DME75_03150 [Verrucomicrobiota bacterium]